MVPDEDDDEGDVEADAAHRLGAEAVEHAPDGVLVIDAGATILFANPTAHRLLGYDGRSLVGVNMFEFLHEDERELGLQAMARVAVEPERIRPTLYHPVRADGVRFPLEINGSAIELDDGTTGVVVIGRAADDQALMRGAATRLVEGHGLDDVAIDVLAHIEARWGGHHAGFLLLSDDGHRLIGELPAALTELLVAANTDDDLPWLLAVATDEVVERATEELPTAAAEVFRALRLVGMAAVPVGAAPTLAGVLVIVADNEAPAGLWRYWTHVPTFLLLRLAFARHCWIGQLETAATTDSLTGLANRAAFHAALGRLATISSGSLALLYVDLDEFKAINDALGHAVGDRVLEVLAERVCAAIRSSDVAGRLGGDELAVVCPDAGRAEAEAVAERIVRAVGEEMDALGHRLHVTASVGVAVRAAGESIDALAVRGDRALYEAKGQGRARWVLAAPPDAGVAPA